QAIVDLYTGGAHCCFVTRFYELGRSGAHVVTRNWGDPGYVLKDLRHDGQTELVSADDRFAYAFAAFAFSAFPVQVWQLKDGTIADVTRSYQPEVRADAAVLWRAYLKARGSQIPDVRGILAAWAADEAMLGRWKKASSALDAVKARGDLDPLGGF